MNAKIYSHTGSEVSTIALPAEVFGVVWNADLVHEVVIGMQGNARTSTAHTKGRGDVRGGGKKPWKQKGTGRARHGSSRSPMWVGGGVSHGPTNEKDYSVKINKKVRAKALATVLSKKLVDAEIIFVDSLALEAPKTAQGKEILKALAQATQQTSLVTKRKNTAVLVLPRRDVVAEKSFRNFGNIEVIQAKDVNPVDLLTYKYVVMVEPASTIEILNKRVVGTAVATKK
jgi:large subunit ribosomal protein L4